MLAHGLGRVTRYAKYLGNVVDIHGTTKKLVGARREAFFTMNSQVVL